MASEIETMSPDPSPGFQRFHDEYCKLIDSNTNQSDAIPYLGGASLNPSDFIAMKIGLDLIANSAFWKPASQSTRCAMQSALTSALEKYSDDLENLLNDSLIYKTQLAECRCPTISNAYHASKEYCGILQYLLGEGIIHNMALVDASGDRLFQGLGISYLRSDEYMQTQKAFSTPGYPYVTILSIQPQRAQTREELLCTEVWTLYYWAEKLVRRALGTTDHCLPMRLVSLCGYEARVISAVFHLGSRYQAIKDIEDRERRSGKRQNQIHIGEYRDLSVLPQFLDLMEELVATPCGNAEVQQKLVVNEGHLKGA